MTIKYTLFILGVLLASAKEGRVQTFRDFQLKGKVAAIEGAIVLGRSPIVVVGRLEKFDVKSLEYESTKLIPYRRGQKYFVGTLAIEEIIFAGFGTQDGRITEFLDERVTKLELPVAVHLVWLDGWSPTVKNDATKAIYVLHHCKILGRYAISYREPIASRDKITAFVERRIEQSSKWNKLMSKRMKAKSIEKE